MKKTSSLLPATGVAALILSMTLAGCSSGTKTETTSSATAESSASATSDSTSSAAAESTDTAHYADVTLPELPGWSDSPDVKWQEGENLYHVAAIQYGETGANIQVLISRSDKPGEDPIEAAKSFAADPLAEGCIKSAEPDPTSMSGFNGFLNAFKCNDGTALFQEAFGIHETAAAPASVVALIGASSIDQVNTLTEALDLITSKGTITP